MVYKYIYMYNVMHMLKSLQYIRLYIDIGVGAGLVGRILTGPFFGVIANF